MKKRDLMDFIDLVEAKAVRSVTTRHDKIINAVKEDLFVKGKYNSRIQKIQDQVNSLQQEAQNLKLDMSDDNELNYPRHKSYDLPYYLSNFVGKIHIKEQLLKDCEFSGGKIPLLIRAKDIEIREVKANYDKVKYVCKNKTAAKDIAEYLEGIGFDISSVRKGDDCVALSVEIDKSKLFVCGDNK